MNVDEICTHEVQFIEGSRPLADAAHQMCDKHVGALIVVAAGTTDRIVGILTDRDLVCGQINRKADLHCLTVEDVMTSDPLTVGADADISEAIQALYGLGVRRAAVVNRAGSLVGVVTLDDLVPALAGQLLLCAQALAA